MSVIIVLITASLLIASGFLAAFFWAVKNNQYEDDYTPSVRILFDNPLNSVEEKEIKLPDNTNIKNENPKLTITI